MKQDLLWAFVTSGEGLEANWVVEVHMCGHRLGEDWGAWRGQD